MRYSVFVDGEWFCSGTYEQCMKVVERFEMDDEFYGVVEMVGETHES